MSEVEKSSSQQSLEFLELMLSSAEQTHGREHPALVDLLNALSEYHLHRKNYGRAEEFLLRAAAISGSSGADAELMKLCRQKLGWLKFLQGQPEDARTFLREAVDFVKADQKTSDESMAQALGSLAYLHVKLGELEEAERVLKELLSFCEKRAKSSEADYHSAYLLVVLSVLADACQRDSEAREYSERAARIIKDKCAIGYVVDYLSLAEIINLYYMQERKTEAFELLSSALMEPEDRFWPHNPVAADTLSSLAEFLRGQKKFKQAESVYKRAIAAREYMSGVEDPEFARLSLNLGNMYLGLRRYADAEPLVKSSLKARVRTFGVEHPSVAACVETYATLLRKTKRAALAGKLDLRAREIRSACASRFK